MHFDHFSFFIPGTPVENHQLVVIIGLGPSHVGLA